MVWEIVVSATCVSAGVMGMMEMDEVGDREIDFAVWDMTNVDSGEFQVKYRFCFSKKKSAKWVKTLTL